MSLIHKLLPVIVSSVLFISSCSNNELKEGEVSRQSDLCKWIEAGIESYYCSEDKRELTATLSDSVAPYFIFEPFPIFDEKKFFNDLKVAIENKKRRKGAVNLITEKYEVVSKKDRKTMFLKGSYKNSQGNMVYYWLKRDYKKKMGSRAIYLQSNAPLSNEVIDSFIKEVASKEK